MSVVRLEEEYRPQPQWAIYIYHYYYDIKYDEIIYYYCIMHETIGRSTPPVVKAAVVVGPSRKSKHIRRACTRNRVVRGHIRLAAVGL